MAAWAGILAYTGFQYSAVDRAMNFNAKDGVFFWSNGYQYGTLEVRSAGEDKTVTLVCENGEMTLSSFVLNGFGKVRFRKGKVFKKGEKVAFEVEANDNKAGLPSHPTLK